MWPNDSRFTWENFGYQPASLIYDALENGRRIYYQERHDDSLVVSQLAAITGAAHQIKVNGSRLRAEDCQPFHSILESMDAKTFQKDACAVMRSFMQGKGVPPWIYRLLPMDKLLSEDDPEHQPPTPRLWANGIARVALIAPRISGGKVQCAVMAMDEGITNQQIPIYDIDTREKICNIQVYGDGGPCYRSAIDADGVEFDIVEIEGYD